MTHVHDLVDAQVHIVETGPRFTALTCAPREGESREGDSREGDSREGESREGETRRAKSFACIAACY